MGVENDFRGFCWNKKYLIMTVFALWDEVEGMYYAHIRPWAGGGQRGQGLEGKGIILIIDRQEIFISHTF